VGGGVYAVAVDPLGGIQYQFQGDALDLVAVVLEAECRSGEGEGILQSGRFGDLEV
jgi:hypothetical protein